MYRYIHEKIRVGFEYAIYLKIQFVILVNVLVDIPTTMDASCTNRLHKIIGRSLCSVVGYLRFPPKIMVFVGIGSIHSISMI